MKKNNYFILLVFILLSKFTFGNITICSWNLCDFGKTKSDIEIDFIANTLKNYDIIAIQEVVAGYGGSQAVARLADALNRKRFNWDYTVSDPTSSSAYKTEKYAFLWKKNKVKLVKDAWLEIKYNIEIDREPFLATFKAEGKEFTVVNFHAITKSMQPETEIKYFKFFQEEYPALNLIFCGDFNCPESHSVFNPLKKMGYKSILQNQKTSLKKECSDDDCLSSEFDNIFYNTNKINYLHSNVILFYKSFSNLKEAHTISDHIPIWFEFSVN